MLSRQDSASPSLASNAGAYKVGTFPGIHRHSQKRVKPSCGDLAIPGPASSRPSCRPDSGRKLQQYQRLLILGPDCEVGQIGTLGTHFIVFCKVMYRGHTPAWLFRKSFYLSHVSHLGFASFPLISIINYLLSLSDNVSHVSLRFG